MGRHLHSSPTVTVPAHLAPYVWRPLAAALERARHQGHDVADEIVELISDLAALGQWHEVRNPPTASDLLPTSSDCGSFVVLDGGPPARWVTTTEAAERLNVSPRRIRQLLEDGRLRGRFTGGVWAVDPHSLADHANLKGA